MKFMLTLPPWLQSVDLKADAFCVTQVLYGLQRLEPCRKVTQQFRGVREFVATQFAGA